MNNRKCGMYSSSNNKKKIKNNKKMKDNNNIKMNNIIIMKTLYDNFELFLHF